LPRDLGKASIQVITASTLEGKSSLRSRVKATLARIWGICSAFWLALKDIDFVLWEISSHRLEFYCSFLHYVCSHEFLR